MEFAHLNCHSYYSLLSGVASVSDLVREAKENGMKTLALTDTNGMYGAVEFYKAAREAGIKPVIGAEIVHDGDSLRLLAVNRTGFAAISWLVSEKNMNKSFSLFDSISKIISAGKSGSVVLMTDNLSTLRKLKRLEPEKLYAEITRDERSLTTEKKLLNFAREEKIPPVATNNVHFIRQKDWALHRILRAVSRRTTLSRLPSSEVVPNECYFKTSGEMVCLFHNLPDAISNAAKLADECNVELQIGKPVFPEFAIPEGETNYSYLCKICFEGAARFYKPLTRKVIKRLSYELEVIDKLGFSPYFLIVWDIVRFARENRIPLVGRGSAADSLVSYVLGITPVDPIAHNLYFERFLNLERSDPPDIDIDFCWRRRVKVLRYVYEKYGYNKVAMIGTYYRFSFRSAIREVARVMGVPESKISSFTKRLPYFSVRSIEEAVKVIPECRNLPLDEEPYRSILSIAERMQDFPRHMSTHPGGIVISPRPVTWYAPLQPGGRGLAITQYDMHSVEDIGLVKIDLLGQRGLTVVQDTVEAVEENYGIQIDFENINPTENKRTRALISRGDTLGCFYIESPAMRSLEKKLNVENYELLVAASSIIRPGVSDSGMMDLFIKYHASQKDAQYTHPMMKKLLSDTYGIMIYQEDVIKVAHHIAGFTFGEADLLRRGMTKKRHWTDIREYHTRFIKGATNKGMDEESAESIWKQIESFSGYSFCKAHSAAYAVISFRSAYLRAHYPAEFMAAVLTNGGGFYHRSVYLEEARRMGLNIHPPLVNESEDIYTGKDGEIRVGLMQIKNLSHSSISSILRERAKDGKFTSLENLLMRTGISITDAQILIRSGALDDLPLNRPQLMWLLDASYNAVRKARAEAEDINGNLFENTEPLPHYSPPELNDYSWQKKLKLEMEYLEMAVSSHPLILYKDAINSTPHVRSTDLKKYSGKTVRVIGWMVTTKRTVTASGDYMKFLTVEDLSGMMEVVLFPRAYKQYGHLLINRGPFLITGKVENELGNITITGTKIELLVNNNSSAEKTGHAAAVYV